MQIEYIHLTETHSTNTYLHALYRSNPTLAEGCIVVTHHQLAGKGQRGNSWEAERGKNLTFSLLLRPSHVIPSRQFILSQLVSLAVVETLVRYAEGFAIKWPNDIYWREKKIGGILIENELYGNHIGCTIVGIGININQAQFLTPAPNPISLLNITGVEHDCKEVLREFAERFNGYYTAHKEGVLAQTTIAESYEAWLYRREGFHTYRDVEGEFEFEATIEAIEMDGHLLLRTAGGDLRRYAFKEVVFVG